MPRKCSVFNCNTNYQNDRGDRTSVYSFPKDPIERELWRLALPKILPTVTDHMGVCGKHWPPNTPMIKRRRLERPKNPPSIFWVANGSAASTENDGSSTGTAINANNLNLSTKAVAPVKSANSLASTTAAAAAAVQAATQTSISYQSLEPMQTAQQQRKRLLPETSDVLQKRSKASALEAAAAAAVQGGLAPMDLSRKKTPATATASSATAAASATKDDVITLSDDEEQELQLLVAKQAEAEAAGVNSEAVVALMKEQAAMLIRLRESLRNEECKLALLKAMRHSQQRSTSAPGTVHHHQQQLQKENGAAVAAASSSTPASARPAASAMQGRSGGLASAQTPGSAGSQKSQHLQSPSAAAIARSQSAATLPMKASSSSAGLAKPAAVAPPPPQISQSQLDAQKAQKKLALRKQLEKSLLEIPNPQPPPSELNFIPSTVTNEFIALVGLEEVVRNISEYDAVLKGGKPTEVKYVFHPFTCVQCGTDYTPVWKRDKPGSKNVICEDCVSTNQKNSIRKEHTARLKAAFVKALKQEEEIEKEFKRYAANPQLAAQAFPHLLPQPAPQPQPQQTQQQSHHHHHQHHHLQQQQQQQHHHMPSLSAAHRSASSLQSLTGSSASLGRLSSAVTTQHQQQQQAAAAAAASQAAAAAAVEQLQRQHTQFLHAQLQAISQLYPTAGQANASSYPYTMPANYLTMLQQAMRQGMNFNPTSLWSTIGAATQQPQQPGKK